MIFTKIIVLLEVLMAIAIILGMFKPERNKDKRNGAQSYPGEGNCSVCGKQRRLFFSGCTDRNNKPVYVNKCPDGHVCSSGCTRPSDWPYQGAGDFWCTRCGNIWGID